MLRNKALNLVLLSAAMVALPGCKDYRTPESVVGTAAGAIHKLDLKLFRKTLDTNAREIYGNTTALHKLNRELNGTGARIDAVALIGSEKDWYYRRDIARTYRVEIVGTPRGTSAEALLKNVTVGCRVEYRCMDVDYDDKYPWGPGWRFRYRGPCQSWTESTFCKISEIE